MHISLADGSERGFKQWSAAHGARRDSGLDRSADAEECHLGIREKAPVGGRHQPWLVPGVGSVL